MGRRGRRLVADDLGVQHGGRRMRSLGRRNRQVGGDGDLWVGHQRGTGHVCPVTFQKKPLGLLGVELPQP